MFKERIELAKRFAREQRELFKEHRHFLKYFPKPDNYNGVLATPGVQLDPLEIGAITINDHYIRDRATHTRNKLSTTESRWVRQAAWNSVVARYKTNLMDAGLEVRLTMEDPDAVDYVSDNIQDTAAFLRVKQGGHERFFPTQDVIWDEDELNYLFDQVGEENPEIQGLYLYTVPQNRALINPKYARISLKVLQPSQQNSQTT